MMNLFRREPNRHITFIKNNAKLFLPLIASILLFIALHWMSKEINITRFFMY